MLRRNLAHSIFIRHLYFSGCGKTGKGRVKIEQRDKLNYDADTIMPRSTPQGLCSTTAHGLTVSYSDFSTFSTISHWILDIVKYPKLPWKAKSRLPWEGHALGQGSSLQLRQGTKQLTAGRKGPSEGASGQYISMSTTPVQVGGGSRRVQKKVLLGNEIVKIPNMFQIYTTGGK